MDNPFIRLVFTTPLPPIGWATRILQLAWYARPIWLRGEADLALERQSKELLRSIDRKNELLLPAYSRWENQSRI